MRSNKSSFSKCKLNFYILDLKSTPRIILALKIKLVLKRLEAIVMKALIIYYSYRGNTKHIADVIYL